MPHIAPVEMFVISLLISLGILRISLNTCGFFSPLLSARSNELFVLVKQPICWLATSDQLKKEFSSI